MSRLVLGALVLVSACVEGPGSNDRPDGGADGGADGGPSLDGADGGLSDGGVADAGPSCVPAAEQLDWKLKFVSLVDQSGLMCLVDPPGSQEATGMCEQAAAAGAFTGATVPGRARSLIQFLQTNAFRPDMSVAIVSYSSQPRISPFGGAFAGAESQDLLSAARSLQSSLGTFGNLQSGLVATQELIEKDLLTLSDGARRRTRYVVVVLSSGIPSPRCSANDSLMQYATPLRPELVWADSAQIPCNEEPPFGPPDLSVYRFRPGTDLNQTAQLDALADRFHLMEQWYGVPAISLHTRLVISERALNACGAFCAQLLPNRMTMSELRSVGRFVLGNLATRTGGTFVDPGEPANLDLSEFTRMPPATFCDH